MRKIMLERKMKGFEFLFALGLISFITIYIFTDSFLTAITVGIFFWVLSIAVLICHYLELADNYYKEVKNVKYRKGNLITNFFIFISIYFVGIAGAFVIVLIVNFLLFFLNITITNSWAYGSVMGISAALGGGISLKIYTYIYKKLGL